MILEPDPAVGRPAGYIVDAQMMATFWTARERTASEFEELLRASGFALACVSATTSPVSIVEAIPV